MSLDAFRRETAEIKTALLLRIDDLCRKLLPDGRREGGLWVSYNPRGDDRTKKPALKVRIKGGDLGAWSDWRSGDKGDAFRLIEHCLGCDFNAARAFALDFLGLRHMGRDERAALKAQTRDHDARREREAAQERQQKINAADRLWRTHTDAGPSEARRHAHGYFAARACPLHLTPNAASETFRFSAATEWWRGAIWRETDRQRIKEAPGPSFPAIHAAMRNRLGLLTACHVTFLDPFLPRKAAVEPPKLMLGIALGAVIEVATGPEGKPFWQALEAHPLIIAEGIETALSLALAIPEARVWAAGSLAGIGHAPVDLACVSRVVFARDNNEGNRQAQKQFDQAYAALDAAGKPLDVMASHVGDDFNDLAKEQ